MPDLFYEYLPMMHALLGGVDEKYERLHRKSVAFVAKHNLYRPTLPDNADMVTVPSVIGAQQLFAKGQQLLTDGCIWAYNATQPRMMPEVYHIIPCPTDKSCIWDEAKYLEAVIGRSFLSPSTPRLRQSRRCRSDHCPRTSSQRLLQKSMQDRRYALHPEAIESVFILYCITGRMNLLDTAWRCSQPLRR
ncbi:hypothetical protein PAAG_12118 [Paracoccidioides lutzii Pb01]|uniref:Uncharacterized protein n=1 Tax=Paracoccidioides lutzii (strain ATCC MYA-826 / Pb01) TaxID=502779 RepID=A0A0A2VJY8_PARBA|nr:hypothetical protein PAAG_12118 [Paracoccidioides lutzii Pb01]KGQ01174.1 hypothetical protein PAAG_12118 [Paracoccidioides lutzii Pb01]